MTSFVLYNINNMQGKETNQIRYTNNNNSYIKNTNVNLYSKNSESLARPHSSTYYPHPGTSNMLMQDFDQIQGLLMDPDEANSGQVSQHNRQIINSLPYANNQHGHPTQHHYLKQGHNPHLSQHEQPTPQYSRDYNWQAHNPSFHGRNSYEHGELGSLIPDFDEEMLQHNRRAPLPQSSGPSHRPYPSPLQHAPNRLAMPASDYQHNSRYPPHQANLTHQDMVYNQRRTYNLAHQFSHKPPQNVEKAMRVPKSNYKNMDQNDYNSTEEFDESVNNNSDKKPRKNATRIRMQQELAFLRAHSTELSEKLNRLKAPNAISQNSTNPTKIWENIAKRQLDERRRVEMENWELKNKLGQHRELVGALERILQMPSTINLLHDSQPPEMIKHSYLAVQWEANSIYEKLLERVDDYFNIIDDDIKRKSADNINIPNESKIANEGTEDNEKLFPDTNLHVSPEDGSFIAEKWGSCVLPFEFKLACNAAWQSVEAVHLKLGDSKQGGCYSKKEDGDVKYVQLVRPVRETEVEASGITFMVFKRYDEVARSVIVYAGETTIQIKEPTSTLLKAVKTRGWAKIEHVHQANDTYTTSKLSSYTRIEGSPFPNFGDSQHSEGMAERRAAQCLQELELGLKKLGQIIENLLIQQTETT